MLIRITAGHFVAGVVLKHDKVVKAAPIIRWMVGHNRNWIERYCATKGWDAEEIDGEGQNHLLHSRAVAAQVPRV
jgi:hypothetical protein